MRKTILAAMVICLAWAGTAWADSYLLINETGHTLKVQSKALNFKTQQVNPQFFELEGAQKDVQFGNDFRLWMLHIYNKDNMAQNFYYDGHPMPNTPEKSWKVTVKLVDDKMDVTMVEQ